ncbi:MAG TPA: hypothetical protein VLV50_03915 [Stellaceae bacterium]|nr:hypothetical protein [Stellaceae bacterium]
MLPSVASDSVAARSPSSGRAARLARVGAVAAALGLTVVGVVGYPLAPGLLGAALLLYGMLLWRYPQAWLVVLPAALPSFDLAPWTGWLAIEEPDFLLLVTVAVLLLRVPPRREHFALRGVSGAATALAIVAAVTATLRGLFVPGVPGGSDVLELTPENALHVVKGLAFALILLPFLRRMVAERHDAPRLFAAGMTAGLALVVAAGVAERAVFPGIRNFESAYRIVATFSSMHFGGGYVGAYLAMALPFALAFAPRRGFLRIVASAIALAALYTLVVTYARAAYGSAVVASVVLALGWLALRREGAPSMTVALPAVLLAMGLGVIALAAADTPAMEIRLAQLVPDLEWRENLWGAGLAVRRPGLAAALVGSGGGTYARLLRARMPPEKRAGNFVRREEDGRRVVALEAGLPLYLGQKVALAPDSRYRIAFALRSPDGGTIEASLCEKLLLYSRNCVDTDVVASGDGSWRRFDGVIPTDDMLRVQRLGVLHRPLELSFTLVDPGTHGELADVSLTGPGGQEHIANGNFATGLTRWFATDDIHTVWRIENQYLMTFFEGGVLGVAAFLAVAVAGLSGAGRAIRAGETIAPAFVAAIAATLASAFFDCPLDVPRLGALFYLAAFMAMTLGERRA